MFWEKLDNLLNKVTDVVIFCVPHLFRTVCVVSDEEPICLSLENFFSYEPEEEFTARVTVLSGWRWGNIILYDWECEPTFTENLMICGFHETRKTMEENGG